MTTPDKQENERVDVEEVGGSRKKRAVTPPDQCGVCGATQTPEWRKGELILIHPPTLPASDADWLSVWRGCQALQARAACATLAGSRPRSASRSARSTVSYSPPPSLCPVHGT